MNYPVFREDVNGADILAATSNNYTVNEPGAYNVRVKGSASAPEVSALPMAISSTLLSQPQSINFAVTTNFAKQGVSSSTNPYSLLANEVSQNITYMDGYGRTIQQVSVGTSPGRKDVIQPTDFNTYGLSEYQYMPYAVNVIDGRYRPNATGSSYLTSEHYQFYNGMTSDSEPRSKTLFEANPLSRILEQGTPGADWQPGGGHSIQHVFNVNHSGFTDAALKNVRQWSANGPKGYNYANGELAINTTTDENAHRVWTYVDKIGRTMLKRVQLDETIEGISTPFLETYYVYDDHGNMTIQIPPKAVAKINSGTLWSSGFRDEWCFIYTYDDRDRLVEVKVPGAASVYYVYDNMDRLILVQDGTLRGLNKWMFMKYDLKGRHVMSGLYTNTTQTTRATVQTVVDNYSNSATYWYEDRGASIQGYTNQTFPTANVPGGNIEPLIVNYYDNYDFDNNGSDDYSYASQSLTGENTPATSAYAMATGNKQLILGTTDWLISYVFYDKYGRAIQSRSNNHLSLPIDNLRTIVYDFSGHVLISKNFHKGAGGSTVTVLNRYAYDHAGRLLRIYQKNNSDAEQVIATYFYNEIGQLKEKNIHCTACVEGGNPSQYQNNGNFLQSVDYKYNIRGWLTHINNAQLSNDGMINNDGNDYFGMELNYNTAASGLSNTVQYNGNISAITWKSVGETAGTTGRRSYAYIYDKSDRLKTSTFKMFGSSAWDKENNTINENMTYDHNGNILTLNRARNLRGLSGLTVTSTPETIDNLVYTYASGNGNKLTKVEDGTNTRGFNNLVNVATEYNYDGNGNLTEDKNKGITAITYNILGKPQQMTFSDGRMINYTYSSSGTKLSMSLTQGGNTVTTHYAGNFVYQGQALSFFGMPEGRVVKNGSSLEYQYSLADHQGNTRVLFTSAPQAAQTFTANMESATNGDFENYPSGGNRSSLNEFDHTDAGTAYTYSNLLNAGYSSRVGVAKSFKIYPGDKVKIEAYAKYSEISGNSSNLTGFAASLLAAYGLTSPGVGETGTASSGLNSYGSIVAAGGTGAGGSEYPKIFVNILIFDKDYNFLDLAYEQINGGAETLGGAVNPHDYMSREYTATQEGYAYLYVSNESATQIDAYFDDVVITRTPTNVIQYNEYYPFGLSTASSWTRDNVTGNNFQYNRSTELNSTTGYYDLFFRNFDPALGRFMQIDPLASKYHNQSTYQYGNNDPVYWSDPSGAGGDAPRSWSDVSRILDKLWQEAPPDGGASWSSGSGYTGGYGYEAAVSYGTAYNQMVTSGGRGSVTPVYSSSSEISTTTHLSLSWDRKITGFKYHSDEKEKTEESDFTNPGAPVIFVAFDGSPKDFDKGAYMNALASKLIANGFDASTQVVQYSLTGRAKAWWNNSPTGTITMTRLSGDMPVEAGGWAKPNNPNSIVIYWGLDGLATTGAGATMDSYINASVHEIGHAFFGFGHDAMGNGIGISGSSPTVMDYRYTYSGIGFNVQELKAVSESIYH